MIGVDSEGVNGGSNIRGLTRISRRQTIVVPRRILLSSTWGDGFLGIVKVKIKSRYRI